MSPVRNVGISDFKKVRAQQTCPLLARAAKETVLGPTKPNRSL
jgi:hypothetical protein